LAGSFGAKKNRQQKTPAPFGARALVG